MILIGCKTVLLRLKQSGEDSTTKSKFFLAELFGFDGDVTLSKVFNKFLLVNLEIIIFFLKDPP